jgi:hypothetical protein
MIDTAGSVDQNYMPQISSFVNSVVQSMPINSGEVQVGIVSFATDQRNVLSLNGCASYTCVYNAIEQIPYIGTR